MEIIQKKKIEKFGKIKEKNKKIGKIEKNQKHRKKRKIQENARGCSEVDWLLLHGKHTCKTIECFFNLNEFV